MPARQKNGLTIDHHDKWRPVFEPLDGHEAGTACGQGIHIVQHAPQRIRKTAMTPDESLVGVRVDQPMGGQARCGPRAMCVTQRCCEKSDGGS